MDDVTRRRTFRMTMPAAPLADPAFDTLMLAIAMLKCAVTVAALAFVAWRWRQPIGSRRRLTYAVSVVAMCAAVTLLFARTALPIVPILFDGGLIALVLLVITDASMLRTLAVRFPNRDALRVAPAHRQRLVSLAALRRASTAHLRRPLP